MRQELGRRETGVSAIAEFHVVRRDDVPALIGATAPGAPASLEETLAGAGHDVGDSYGWSGYTFVFVMEFLASRGVYLGPVFPEAEERLGGALEADAYVLAPESFADLGLLDPDRYSEADIREHFDRLGMGFEEAGMAGKDTIAALAEQLGGLGPDRVLLVFVG